jgi:ATP-binding cassette subfamily C protein/ATP-binding cassette subfamily C protein LapB
LLMVSHRPSHLKLCDKILLIDQGQVIMFGPPTEVLPKIPKDFL